MLSFHTQETEAELGVSCLGLPAAHDGLGPSEVQGLEKLPSPHLWRQDPAAFSFSRRKDPSSITTVMGARFGGLAVKSTKL